ncbi:MAG: hypothetical protein IJQ21_12885 [Lachnospiraceae bacterium]|nr:hypothetical protein [Lachnospiraceae bacterium]
MKKTRRNPFLPVLMLCLVLAGCGAGGSGTPGEAPAAETDASASAETAADTAASENTGAPGTASVSAMDAATGGSDTPDAPVPEAAEGINLTDESITFITFETAHHEMAREAENDRRITLSYDTLLTGKKLSDADHNHEALDRTLVSQEWARERDYMNRFSSVEVAMNRAKGTYLFSLSQRLRVFRADSRVFSYLVESMEMLDDGETRASAADDRYTCLVYNIDPETGNTIALSDVVNDTDTLITLAAAALTDKYVDRNPAFTAQEQFEGVDLEEAVRAMVTGEAKEESDSFFAWSPCYYGLRLIFARDMLVNPQGYRDYLEEVSSVEVRDLKKAEVVIPYTAAPEIFTPEYTALPASYIAELEPGVEYACDFGEGVVPFLVNAPRKFENKTILYTGEYTIRTGSSRQSFNTIGAEAYSNYGTKVYLVKTADGFFLYLDAQYENETDRLHVYAYGDGAFSFTGVSGEMLDAERMPPFDPFAFTTEGIFQILPDPYDPAYRGIRGWHTAYVSGNGMPASDEKEYRTVEEDIRTTAIDLNLDVLADASSAIPVKELIPAGTTLSMFRVTPVSHADFRTEDGKIIRMFINGVDTIDLIDGHEIMEAFMPPGQ